MEREGREWLFWLFGFFWSGGDIEVLERFFSVAFLAFLVYLDVRSGLIIYSLQKSRFHRGGG
jgi:hypothetical protein